MIDIQEKKNKIISFIEENGPSLPVRIAKTIEMDPVFASAILSELLSTKKIKMSHLKVGSSSLYLLPGQEKQLEEHSDNLKSIEKDVMLKLQREKVLVDEDEEPATRVALRSIKDFAMPFKFQEKVMWRYAFTPEAEIKEIVSPAEPEEKPIIKEEVKVEEEEVAEEEIENNNAEQEIEIEEEEAKEEEVPEEEEEVPKAWEAKKEEIKEAKEKSKKIESIFEEEEIKPQPEFLTEIKNFLEQKDIEFLEEIRTEKKEIMATVKITSQLGDIEFLLIAKNKKSITKDELEASIQVATKNNMPCLLLIRKEPSKNIQKLIEKNHLIKLEILE